MSAKKPAKKAATAKSAPATRSTPRTPSVGFSKEERDAARDRIQELKAAAKSGKSATANDEPAVLAKLATMSVGDRAMGERLHDLIRAAAPMLAPRLWYGMPAYAKNGAVVCFFQGAQKFKTRYSTLGFSDKAQLDDGQMWPTAFAIDELTPAVEARIVALVKQAVG